MDKPTKRAADGSVKNSTQSRKKKRKKIKIEGKRLRGNCRSVRLRDDFFCGWQKKKKSKTDFFINYDFCEIFFLPFGGFSGGGGEIVRWWCCRRCFPGSFLLPLVKFDSKSTPHFMTSTERIKIKVWAMCFDVLWKVRWVSFDVNRHENGQDGMILIRSLMRFFLGGKSWIKTESRKKLREPKGAHLTMEIFMCSHLNFSRRISKFIDVKYFLLQIFFNACTCAHIVTQSVGEICVHAKLFSHAFLFEFI